VNCDVPLALAFPDDAVANTRRVPRVDDLGRPKAGIGRSGLGVMGVHSVSEDRCHQFARLRTGASNRQRAALRVRDCGLRIILNCLMTARHSGRSFGGRIATLHQSNGP
jgi:hypothetical protein